MFASTWFIVNQRRLVNPPAMLWRVEHSGNQDSVFSSRASPAFTGSSDFNDVKRAHADWHSHRATPFLSTFSNFLHAANWARHRVDEMGDPCVQIHEIKTDGLLVCGAGGDECLVIDEIPDANVVKTIDLRPPPPRRRRGRRRGGRGRKSQNTNCYDSSNDCTWYVVHARRLEQPPATLWRVEHSGNQDSVFSSRASPEFGTDGDFAAAKRQHLNWYNKQPTPFLSTFSHHGHALNWARQRVTQMHDPCVQVHEIDTNGLLVFGAGGDEFLVLDEIPLGNVMNTLSMRRSTNGRRRQQQRMGRGRRTGGYDPYYVPQSKPADEDYSDTTSSGESYYY